MRASWSELLAVGAVVMVISYTIATQRIFLPFRDRCGGKDTWLGYLVSCPFCASWWVAFVVVPLTATRAFRIPYDWGVFDDVLGWFLTVALVVAIAAFLRVAFFFVDETQGLVRRQQKTVEVERELLAKRAKAIEGAREADRLQ